MTTIILYIVLILLSATGIITIPSSLLSMLIATINKNFYITTLVSSIIWWIIIAFLWKLIVGQNIPILALGICIVALFFNSWLQRKKLNANAQKMLAGEVWAIIIIGIALLIKSNPIRWM